ncbi:MAG: Ldh family oxidoreductase [Anaerolineaceae bacterium]|nr:Ldh family oxidoreductase [Anaerolineaceae bacterium]
MAYEIRNRDLVNHYPLKTLQGFARDFLQALGATEEEAAIVSDGVLTAAQWWHPGQGQGLEKFFRYRRRVQGGGILPGVEMTWLREGPSFALLDAAKGFGYVSAHRAMKRAIEKARASGIAIVGVRHSNHFGIAGYHALQAAQAGLIGWAFTNAAAEMAPWGSALPVLGTNPWGFAIPRTATHAIVLDMALTMSGKGMMRWYQQEGRAMPANWALTPDGRETTDPDAAMDGPVLPIGEYKGYGLSFVSDVLAGVMTGALFGMSVFQDDRNFDVGHIMIAIDPQAFMGEAEFQKRLEELVAEVKGAPAIDPQRPVLLPGEIEFKRMAERQRDGVPVARETVEGLRELAQMLDVDFPL